MMRTTLILGAEALWLMSWWAPILMALGFLGWGWVVSTIYDKDAERFYLERREWNTIHMTAGAVALAVVIATPMPHYITIPALYLVLVIDLAWYAISRNKDERVGEAFKWSLDLSKVREARAAKKAGKHSLSATLVFKGPKGELAVPAKESPEYEVRTAAEAFIQKLLDLRGAQLDVAALKDGSYGFSALVDGVRKPLEQAPAGKAIPIIDLYKVAAGLDPSDRRRKVTGDFKIGPAGGGAGPMTPFRLTAMGSAAGMQITLLLDPEGQVTRRVDALGLHENQLKDLRSIIEERTGVVLVVAPADSGRTSTLYALVREHDAYTSNVQTIELEPQMTIEGVRQNKFDPAQDGAEFSTTVRSILRRDPDVVAVAEVPDDATAKEVSKADLERTRVYCSFRAEGALPGVQIFARMVGDQKGAAKCLHGVVAQRLVRKLCENCRVAFTPTADMLKKLGLPADTKQLYRTGGQVLIKDKPSTCPVCNGAGFFGQIGLFEVYPIGEAERVLIAANDITGLKGAFRQKKQQSIQTAGLMHAVQGDTSVDEVVRIMQPAAAAGPTAAGGEGEQRPSSAKPQQQANAAAPPSPTTTKAPPAPKG